MCVSVQKESHSVNVHRMAVPIELKLCWYSESWNNGSVYQQSTHMCLCIEFVCMCTEFVCIEFVCTEFVCTEFVCTEFVCTEFVGTEFDGQLNKLSTPFPARGFPTDTASSTLSKVQMWPQFNRGQKRMSITSYPRVQPL